MYDYPVNIPKRNLVFHFYTFDNFIENRAIQIHLKCLKRYHNIFDESLFVISLDNIENRDLILKTENEILKCGFENARFLIRQNDEFREARTFYEEVAQKLDTFEGLVFFGHTKGVSNYEQFPESWNSLDQWIHGLYFLNLEFMDEVEMMISKRNVFFYGAFLHVDRNEVHWKRVPGIYFGAMYWLYPKIIILNKKFRKNIISHDICPPLMDRNYAEGYPTHLAVWQDANHGVLMSSHNLLAIYAHNIYTEAESCMNWLCGNNEIYQKFLRFCDE